MFDTISKFRYELLMHTSQITSRVRPALRPALGNLLKQWRERRGLSQLDLGLKSDVSSRHLSFVESGRSQPTREMVLRLAAALQIPLREQNLLLEAAGFAQLYRETGLSDPEMKQTKKAIDLILKVAGTIPGGCHGSSLEHSPRQQGCSAVLREASRKDQGAGAGKCRSYGVSPRRASAVDRELD